MMNRMMVIVSLDDRTPRRRAVDQVGDEVAGVHVLCIHTLPHAPTLRQLLTVSIIWQGHSYLGCWTGPPSEVCHAVSVPTFSVCAFPILHFPVFFLYCPVLCCICSRLIPLVPNCDPLILSDFPSSNPASALQGPSPSRRFLFASCH